VDVQGFAADVHGEDLAAILTELGVKRAHIVAHSAGADAAWFFAVNHPEMVRTLVIKRAAGRGPAGRSAYCSGTDVLRNRYEHRI
jgi:pimeloyl-ACP methyl ester carboxylesterase